jgi:hypothetical protein
MPINRPEDAMSVKYHANRVSQLHSAKHVLMVICFMMASVIRAKYAHLVLIGILFKPDVSTFATSHTMGILILICVLNNVQTTILRCLRLENVAIGAQMGIMSI